MNIVVIGCGYWGKNHVRVLDELGHLYGVCDKDIKKITGRKISGSTGQGFLDYKFWLDDPKVGAVVIATPPDTHVQIAIDALQAGKHVLVEKPMAMTTPDAEIMIENAEANKKVLMVGHILEYHPAIQALKKYIADGNLGKIRYIYSNRLNIGRVRRGEDVLQSFAPHDIGLITSILGVSPTAVEVKETSYLTPGVSDVTVMHLDYSQIGVKAHIFVSWVHPVKEQRLVVIGEKGMAVFDDQSNEKVKIYHHKIEWEDTDSVATIDKSGYELLEGALVQAEPLKNELKHFIACCENGTSPHTNGNYGYEVVDILERAQKKDDEYIEVGRVVVGPPFPIPKINEKEILSMWQLAGIAVHESAYIDEDVEIGEGTKIWHFSHIQKGAKIGENCVIGQNVNIGPGVVIGNNVKIQNNVSVYEGVVIEDDVFLGPSCVFTNVRIPAQFGRKVFEITVVRKGVIIGANVTIVCGVEIGENAFIGAGAVVTKDIPPNQMWFGNPATYRYHG